MLNKRSLLPVKLGVIFGIVGGWIHCSEDIQAHDYLRYHLFNTTSKLLATEMDRRVLILSSVFYVIWLISLIAKTRLGLTLVSAFIRFAKVISGSRMKSSMQAIYRLLMGCVIAVVALLWLGLLAWIKQFDSVFFQIAFAQSKWQIIVAGIIIILGALYLIGSRIRATRVVGINWRSPLSANDLAERVGRLLQIVERQNVLYSSAALLLLLVNAAVVLFWTDSAISLPKKPNIIIIMADTLRADHVGCYGYHRNTTPNIDKLAKDGIRFNQAIANSSWTTASVSSFMTSQYPQTVILKGPNSDEYGGTPAMSTHVVTIAEFLRDHGYATGAAISNPQFGDGRNGSQGFVYFKDCSQLREITSPTVISKSREWITKNKDKRLFFFALLMDIHSPYRRHPKFDFDPGYTGKCRDEVSVSRLDTLATAKCSVSHMQALYDSNVAHTDYYIGLLIDDLKKKGLYDNSIIVFLGDHGEQFADHGGFFHGNTLYRELLKVPLIIKLPHQTGGRVVNGYFPLINLFPTLLREIGEDPSSIKPKGKAVNLTQIQIMRDDYTFAATSLYDKLRSVQNQEYKYVLDMHKLKGQLFDLKNDPLEQNNIVNKEPSISAAMQKLIMANETEVSVSNMNDSAIPTKLPSKVEQDKLRSLGYLQ